MVLAEVCDDVCDRSRVAAARQVSDKRKGDASRCARRPRRPFQTKACRSPSAYWPGSCASRARAPPSICGIE